MSNWLVIDRIGVRMTIPQYGSYGHHVMDENCLWLQKIIEANTWSNHMQPRAQCPRVQQLIKLAWRWHSWMAHKTRWRWHGVVATQHDDSKNTLAMTWRDNYVTWWLWGHVCNDMAWQPRHIMTWSGWNDMWPAGLWLSYMTTHCRSPHHVLNDSVSITNGP